MKVRCILVRHGKTQGNIEKRYIGCRTDEALLVDSNEMMGLIGEQIESRLRDFYGDINVLPEKIYVSPMLRCRQTADILFPKAEQVMVEDLRETDFGDFENKNYMELSGNPEYQKWIDSNGTLPFPNGETREHCIERTVKAFCRVLDEIEADNTTDESTVDRNECTVGFVIHGGSIMAIMSSLTGKDYYDFQVSCCEGYILECSVENGKIFDISYNSLFGGNNS